MSLGLAGAISAGCGDSSATDSSCAAALRWNQTLYLGMAMEVPGGEVLGRGVVPACTGESDDQQVTVRRVAKVRPALAIVRDGEPPGKRTVYLAPGFFTVLADHPLHRGVLRPRRCSRRFRLTGTVIRTPTTNGVQVRAGGRERLVSVVTTTEISGFRRAGHPYLQRRDLVQLRGRRCDLPDFAGALVADVVRPAD